MVDDREIRVTVTGRDKISALLADLQKKLEDFGSGGSTSLRDVNRALQDSDNALKNVGRDLDKNNANLNRHRTQVDNLSRSYRALKQSIGDALHNRVGASTNANLIGGGTARRGPNGEFIRNNQNQPGSVRSAAQSFLGGLQTASGTQAAIKARASQEKEAVAARNRQLSDELRQRQIEIKSEGAQRKADVKSELDIRKAGIENEIKTLRSAAKEDATNRLSQIAKERIAAGTTRSTGISDIRSDTATQIGKLRSKLGPGTSEADDAAIRDEIGQLKQAQNARIQSQHEAYLADIQRLDQAAIKIRTEDSSALDTEIAKRRSEASKEATIALGEVDKETAKRQSNTIREFNVARAANKAPDIVSITKDELSKRDIDNAANSFDRLGRRAGLALGDIRRGFEQGRTGLTNFKQAVAAAETPMAKLGVASGQFVRNLGNLVNLRWFILISALQLVGTLVTQLGAALVAIASSAILAGAALGAAFATGLGEAAITGGLLFAALNKVKSVFAAVKLADQARSQQAAGGTETMKQQRTAAEQLADAHYALKQAIQGVSDAEYSEQQAVQGVTAAHVAYADALKNLAQARQQAARDIVDATFAERDAALSLKEAELSVVEAKQKLIDIEKTQRQQEVDVAGAQQQVKEAQARVAQLKQEGASSQQILAAQQQLNVAQNSVTDLQAQQTTNKTDVQDAALAVKRAQLSRDEAVVTNKRAIQDGEKARKQGVAGNQQVIDAQRQLKSSIQGIAQAEHSQADAERAVADAVHSVAIARRSLKDSQTDAKTSTVKAATEENLKIALAGLDPAQKKLFTAVENIKKQFKQSFNGITDIIVDAITRAVNRSVVLLKDPKILAAARALAVAIGKGIDQISKFTISPEFRKEIEILATDAAKNLPKVVDALLNIAKAFLRIASSKGAIAIFDDLIGRVDKVTKRFSAFTGNQQKLDKFLGVAGANLNSWIHLGDAIGKVIGALVHDSGGAGKSFVDGIASALDRLAKFLNTHQTEVSKFFTNLHNTLKGLAPLIGSVFTVLFKAFTSPQGDAFSKLILKTVIPGLALMLKFIGLVSGAFLKLSKFPVLGKFLILGLQIAVAEKALNKIFPVTQRATDALQKLVFHPKDSINNIKKFASAFQTGIGSISKSVKGGLFGGLAEDGTQTTGLVGKFKSLGQKMATGFTTGFSKAGSAIKNFTVAGAQLISTFVKTTIAKIAAIDFAAMASGFVDALAAMGTAILAFSKAVAVAFITPPLAIILLITAVIAAILILNDKFHFLGPTLQFLKKIGEDVFGWFIKNWKLLGEIIAAIFTFPAGIIAFAIVKWHDKIISLVEDLAKKVWGWFQTLGGWIIDVFVKLPLKIIGYFAHLGSNIVTTIIKGLSGLSKGILGVFTGIISDILGLFDKAAAKIAKKIEGPLKSVENALGIDNTASPEDIAKKALSGDSFSKGIIAAQFTKAASGDQNAIDFLAQIDAKTLKKLQGVESHNAGGIAGSGGGSIASSDTVPAMLTPGEWVLTNNQQLNLATRLGTTRQELAAHLFGTNTKKKPAGTTPSLGTSPYVTSKFTLVPEVDADGNQLWFLEFGDQSYGQVTNSAAARIVSSGGEWFPSYALRDSKRHRGFFHDPVAVTKQLNLQGIKKGIASGALNPRRYSLGGIVPGVQGFAQGGPVLNSPGVSNNKNSNKNVNVNIHPHVEGDTDWHYVMRVAALHAEGSF